MHKLYNTRRHGGRHGGTEAWRGGTESTLRKTMAAGDENVLDTNGGVGGVEAQGNEAAKGMAVEGEVRKKINMNKYVVHERESGEVRSEFDLLAGVAARKYMAKEELVCVDIRVSTLEVLE